MNGKDFGKVLEDYSMGQVWLNDIELEIEGGENEVDALTLLRAYETQTEMDTKIALAQKFVLNKRVVFSRKGELILAFVYTGGDIGRCFNSAPYLLDILLTACLGLMLKKLTPPSDDSETEERQ